MTKKIIAGTAIALAAGIAAFIYRRNKNKIDEAAADVYNDVHNELYAEKERLETNFA